MILTLPERIQILRKRAGLNQTQFGEKAFNAASGYGRTKIKNIELGKQRPTQDDIRNIAKCFDLSPAQLMGSATSGNDGGSDEMPLSFEQLFRAFPDLDDYLGMLDKAIEMSDAELVDYLCGRIAAMMQAGPQELTAPDAEPNASAG